MYIVVFGHDTAHQCYYIDVIEIDRENYAVGLRRCNTLYYCTVLHTVHIELLLSHTVPCCTVPTVRYSRYIVLTRRGDNCT